MSREQWRVCDACPTRAPETAPGWAHVSVYSATNEAIDRDLCPSCAGALARALGLEEREAIDHLGTEVQHGFRSPARFLPREWFQVAETKKGK